MEESEGKNFVENLLVETIANEQRQPRALREFTLPDNTSQTSIVKATINANNFEIKSTSIQMV